MNVNPKLPQQHDFKFLPSTTRSSHYLHGPYQSSHPRPSSTVYPLNPSGSASPTTATPLTDAPSKPTLDRCTLLQDRECDLVFYQTHFREQFHYNYVAATSAQGPIVVSIATGDPKGVIRILVRTTQRLFGISPLSILGQICPAIPLQSLTSCTDPRLAPELERMEERQIIRCYKFGVYQLLPGQTLEHQGLANAYDFLEFLQWLGEPIKLNGWKGYRAGLDTVGDTTGETSVFTHWNAYQIMFHCAPYLPFNPSDTQQVERRRFIGNDIVVIVFKESDDEEQFDLDSVGSRQNHIICIVRPIPSATNSGAVAYRVAIAVKNGIRNFAPLDFPVVLQRDDASRDLLLLKLISGERAAYRAKAFATQLLRTRESLLRDVIESCS
ncbi:MAG: hypothetical protein BYD32DRAFT_459397 [Podila humilis]|nr:MAG: hypothetical protein BYD32DRAFT_459397 [Podila humilis]